MPVPTAYTESQLAAYMHTVLGDVAAVLGWGLTGGTGNYAEAVTEVLIGMDVADLAEVLPQDVPKLRALARREAWRLAVFSLSGRSDFEVDGQSFKDGQLVNYAGARLADADAECTRYGASSYVVGVGRLRSVNDPYAWQTAEERAL